MTMNPPSFFRLLQRPSNIEHPSRHRTMRTSTGGDYDDDDDENDDDARDNDEKLAWPVGAGHEALKPHEELVVALVQGVHLLLRYPRRLGPRKKPSSRQYYKRIFTRCTSTRRVVSRFARKPKGAGWKTKQDGGRQDIVVVGWR